MGTLPKSASAADAYLIAQDDVLFACGLRGWLEDELWHIAQFGVLSLYTAAAVADGRPDGWFALEPENLPMRAYGALAVVLPADVARMLLRDPPGQREQLKTDLWLATFCARKTIVGSACAEPLRAHRPRLGNQFRPEGRRAAAGAAVEPGASCRAVVGERLGVECGYRLPSLGDHLAQLIWRALAAEMVLGCIGHDQKLPFEFDDSGLPSIAGVHAEAPH